MVKHKTSDQIREQHLHDMGPELGAVYNALHAEVSALHMRWAIYRQLYAESPERIHLLNEAAGFFFGLLQGTLLEDILLQMARLTDPPESAGKKNLTLMSLPDLITDQTLSLEIEALASVANTACDAGRKWRHKRLAHNDLALALATSEDPLPGISRADIEAVLLAFRNVLNRIEREYWNDPVAYKDAITANGDAESLVYYLNLGIQAERE